MLAPPQQVALKLLAALANVTPSKPVTVLGRRPTQPGWKPPAVRWRSLFKVCDNQIRCFR